LNNTQVFQIPKANFAITAGEPKSFTKQSDHGRVSRNQAKIATGQHALFMLYKRCRIDLVSPGYPHTFLP
jgi:hypothetical protein